MVEASVLPALMLVLLVLFGAGVTLDASAQRKRAAHHSWHFRAGPQEK